jgi:hypothetical protein
MDTSDSKNCFLMIKVFVTIAMIFYANVKPNWHTVELEPEMEQWWRIKKEKGL